MTVLQSLYSVSYNPSIPNLWHVLNQYNILNFFYSFLFSFLLTRSSTCGHFDSVASDKCRVFVLSVFLLFSWYLLSNQTVPFVDIISTFDFPVIQGWNGGYCLSCKFPRSLNDRSRKMACAPQWYFNRPQLYGFLCFCNLVSPYSLTNFPGYHYINEHETCASLQRSWGDSWLHKRYR